MSKEYRGNAQEGWKEAPNYHATFQGSKVGDFYEIEYAPFGLEPVRGTFLYAGFLDDIPILVPLNDKGETFQTEGSHGMGSHKHRKEVGVLDLEVLNNPKLTVIGSVVPEKMRPRRLERIVAVARGRLQKAQEKQKALLAS